MEVLQRTDGALLALFPDKWRVQAVERNQPELVLEPLVAGAPTAGGAARGPDHLSEHLESSTLP